MKICFGHANHNCLLELMKSTVTIKIRLHYKILIFISPHYKIEVNNCYDYQCPVKNYVLTKNYV